MKKIVLVISLILLSSCQWIMTHPIEDAEAVGIVEEAAKDIYEYESKTLSPAPPVNQDIWHKNVPVTPPFKP